jgi:hypothetical protein
MRLPVRFLFIVLLLFLRSYMYAALAESNAEEECRGLFVLEVGLT